MTDIRERKRELRRRVRALLTKLSPGERRIEEARCLDGFLKSNLWRESVWLLGYLPMPDEFNLLPLYETVLNSGRKLALVRVAGRGLRFHRVTDLHREWRVHRYGMREPDPGEPAVDPRQAAAEGGTVLVPGLAWDLRGYRIGYGGGFYDRLLADLPGELATASLLYSCQLIDAVPLEPHDIAVERLFRP